MQNLLPQNFTISSPNHLDTLNDVQRQAVEIIEGPVLVLAGAGTGKTKVLTSRIANIISHRHAWPGQILAVTFTNKAANEMKNRINHILEQPVEGMWFGTFHSLCARILRRHAELINRSSDFTILNSDDQLRLLKQLITARGLDEKKFAPRAMASMIGRWKDRALTPGNVPAHEATDVVLSLYEEYQERLRILNALDFGDLILMTVQIFNIHPEILEQYQQQFKYILVDEYQDTNVVQYLWLRLLAKKHSNICCVGDDDQSIYGWRGAEITNILRFEQDFPGAKVIRLEQNYRSTSHILNAAGKLISNNRDRLGKTLWSDEGQGEKVQIIGTWDGAEEARIIGEEIEDAMRTGTKLSEIAILVRASFQTREFEDRFITLGLPYKIVGGSKFYDRQEIKDAIAYLRIIVQPNDSLAFERIINTPRRGIGDTTLQILHHLSRMEEIPLLEAARRIINTDELRGKTRSSLIGLIQNLDRWRLELANQEPGNFTRMILDESGYTRMWQEDKSPDALGRLENLKEFVRAIDEFKDMGEFLEYVSLVMDNAMIDANIDAISIMTMHSAKGLEFETVFLAGWEEGLFPHPLCMEENGLQGLEEERRLAYVGLTRAKRKAIISYSSNRRKHGVWHSTSPSRFLSELPMENCITINRPGAYVQNINKSMPAKNTKPTFASLKKTNGQFEIGARVFHEKFGYGMVIEIDGDKLEVDFDKSNCKRIMAIFVRPA